MHFILHSLLCALQLLILRTEFALGDLKPQPLDPVLAAGKAPKANEPIIVVGAGLAGMSAALEALQSGARVILIDKEPNVGGNSAKASSGINGCGTKVQKKMGITDSPERFYADTMSAGDRENDPILVDILVHESVSAIEFLIEQGVALADVNLCGGHSVPRTHWLLSPKEGKPLPIGVAIVRALKSKLDEWQKSRPERLEYRLGTPVLGLVTWNDFVTGVRVKGENGKIAEISGKAVVLTTGGFSSDRDNETSLLSEFAASVLSLPTTNGPFATGDGVKMARAMGAGLVGMERVQLMETQMSCRLVQIQFSGAHLGDGLASTQRTLLSTQIHPTAFIDPKEPTAGTKFLAAEALRGKGAILVNERGRRFCNELGRRDQTTERINKDCARQKSVGNLPIAWMVMNRACAESFGWPAFTFYAKIKGFFKKVANIAELAAEIGCPVEQLRSTIAEYNAFADKRAADEDFKDPYGKAVFPFKFDADEPFFVARITPAIHYTMGGLKIDKKAFVYNEFMERPFQGLLAAGEVTGGVHGRNRLAGNSLLGCVVFGRIAGKSAAEINYQEALGVSNGVGSDAYRGDSDREEL